MSQRQIEEYRASLANLMEGNTENPSNVHGPTPAGGDKSPYRAPLLEWTGTTNTAKVNEVSTNSVLSNSGKKQHKITKWFRRNPNKPVSMTVQNGTNSDPMQRLILRRTTLVAPSAEGATREQGDQDYSSNPSSEGHTIPSVFDCRQPLSSTPDTIKYSKRRRQEEIDYLSTSCSHDNTLDILMSLDHI